MGPVFHRLEVLCGRGPAPAGVEKVLFRLSSEIIVGNLIFLESTFVADPPAPVSQVEFARRAVTDRAHVIFFAHRLHQGRQCHAGINLPQQFLDHLLALPVPAFPEVPEAQVSIFIEQST